MDAKKLEKLRECIKNSETAQGKWRETRMAILRQIIGNHYSDKGSDKKVPVNLLELAMTVYSNKLVSDNPKASITTNVSELRPKAYELQIAVNHVCDEINLRESIMLGVTEAMMGIGIFKVGVTEAKVEQENILADPGLPFVEVVSPDDFVFDTSARRWEEALFLGNRFRVPLDHVKESGIYNQKVVKELVPSLRKDYGKENGKNRDRADELLSDNKEGNEEYLDHVELIEVYCPFEGKLITMSPCKTRNTDGVLREVDWDGPEGGPYHLLRFIDVPGNLMPLPPLFVVLDLHDASNRTYRKTINQSDRQKTVTVVRGGADADGNRLVKASDGEMVRLDDPNSVREIVFGGANQSTVAAFMQSRDLFSWMMGNLSAMAGLNAMSATVGQDQMMQQASSERIKEMQRRVISCVADIMKDIAFYVFYDPTLELKLEKQITGTDIRVPFYFSSETREGDFLDYNFHVDPYSLAGKTPGERSAEVLRIFQQVLMPAMPIMQQEGTTISISALIDLLAKEMNNPSLREILTSGSAMIGDQKIGDYKYKPAQTTRNYVRRSEAAPANPEQDAAKLFAAAENGGGQY